VNALGGWPALHYLVFKGLAETPFEAIRYYGQYGCGYATAGFPSVTETCRAVHAAGGKAVLAHPGESIPERTDTVQMLTELFAFGLDGLECYYPKHSTEMTGLCLDFCRERGLLVTGGSDCHGAFGSSAIGEIRTPIESLRLDGLL
jgi:predicted metal-dependent phosphoesterase TrpH